MASEQKYKEGDGPLQEMESTNKTELLFFSDKAAVYKTKVSQFADTKAKPLLATIFLQSLVLMTVRALCPW